MNQGSAIITHFKTFTTRMRDLFVIAKVLHLDCTVAFLRIECIYQKPTVGREGLSGDGLPLIKVFISERNFVLGGAYLSKHYKKKERE